MHGNSKTSNYDIQSGKQADYQERDPKTNTNATEAPVPLACNHAISPATQQAEYPTILASSFSSTTGSKFLIRKSIKKQKKTEKMGKYHWKTYRQRPESPNNTNQYIISELSTRPES